MRVRSLLKKISKWIDSILVTKSRNESEMRKRRFSKQEGHRDAISLEDATAVVQIKIAYKCYNQSGVAERYLADTTMGDIPFLFSTRNKYTAIGCDTVGFVGDANYTHYSRCISYYNSTLTSQFNFTEELSSCAGIGCCQTAVPKGLDTLGITLGSYSNHRGQLDTNPCSFGLLSDPSWYKDSANFTLSDTAEKHDSSPVVLDWAIRRDLTCADTTDLEYICGTNTNCISSYNSPGYLCSYNKGFNGNPFTKAGCQDINECDDPETYPCDGKCTNTAGNYTCAYSFGKSGCHLHTATKIAIGQMYYIVRLWITWVEGEVFLLMPNS